MPRLCSQCWTLRARFGSTHNVMDDIYKECKNVPVAAKEGKKKKNKYEETGNIGLYIHRNH